MDPDGTPLDSPQGGSPRPDHGGDPGAASFEEVLAAELRLIRERRRTAAGGPARPEADALSPESPPAASSTAALREDLVGLAFSGGGIRSATFNLGVLQGLASLRLLSRFDYLSTVSGGGYIGSWLSSWIRRASGRGAGGLSGVRWVEEQLRSGSGGAADDSRPEAASAGECLGVLRRFSNYLTPKAGVFSADSWAVVATYLRNLLLVQGTLVCGLGVLLLLPRLLEIVILEVDEFSTSMGYRLEIAYAATLVLVLLAIRGVARGLEPSRREWAGESGGIGSSQGKVLLGVGLPLLGAALLVALLLATEASDPEPRAAGQGVPVFEVVKDWLGWTGWWWAAVTAILYTGTWATVIVSASALRLQAPRRLSRSALLLSGLPTGAAGGLLLFAVWCALEGEIAGPRLWWTLTLGVPAVLVIFVVATAVHVGLVGTAQSDHQREWLSRLGAWLLLAAVAWTVLFGIAILGPPLSAWAAGWAKVSLTAGWVGTTLAGLVASRGGEGGGRPGPVRRALVAIAPYVFILGLLLWLSVGIERVVAPPAESDAAPATSEEPSGAPATSDEPPGAPATAGGETDAAGSVGPENCCTVLAAEIAGRSEAAVATGPPLPLLVGAHLEQLGRGTDGRVWGLLVGLAALFALLGWRVDVNQFSMHSLYRNRLVRCYLGATLGAGRRDRERERFTGFNEADDLPLGQLAESDSGPVHLVNCTLNLVAGNELAWQQRKGASFVFGPTHCGFETPTTERGFRPTGQFAGDPEILRLGTAMAISGAAVSPSMGFRSSAAFSFLLTLFNVRLGWWLGNPSSGRRGRSLQGLRMRRWSYWQRSGPSFAIRWLASELLGLTREETRYVNLSDGGHFENLGLYELVRRRCRFIVACDAGADPALAFDDLANAIRKCRVDLGIEIHIVPSQIRPDPAGLSRWHCAVGTIRYTDEEEGTLLYLKSALTGDEPEDLLNYRVVDPDFPHQSTGDQWFDESQFESYRRLGEHTVMEALGKAVEEATVQEAPAKRTGVDEAEGSVGRARAGGGRVDLEILAHVLRERWTAPSPTIAAFTRHSRTLDRLFGELREDQELAFLGEQFYPEWGSLMADEPKAGPPSWLPGSEDERRRGFYFCSSLIQLMEDVYVDCDFENLHDHPDHRGWMNLFKHWSWAGMFRVTWAIGCCTYGLRFQRFCQRHLDLGLGTLEVDDLLPDRAPGAWTTADLDHLAAASGELNVVELDILRRLLRDGGFDRVARFQVVVESPFVVAGGKVARTRYSCGFAAMAGPELVCFRIQDHLRRMGLARRSLRRLLDGADLRLGSADRFRALAEDSELRVLFPRDAVACFERLFRSVERETDRHRRPRGSTDRRA